MDSISELSYAFGLQCAHIAEHASFWIQKCRIASCHICVWCIFNVCILCIINHFGRCVCAAFVICMCLVPSETRIDMVNLRETVCSMSPNVLLPSTSRREHMNLCLIILPNGFPPHGVRFECFFFFGFMYTLNLCHCIVFETRIHGAEIISPLCVAMCTCSVCPPTPANNWPFKFQLVLHNVANSTQTQQRSSILTSFSK